MTSTIVPTATDAPVMRAPAELVRGDMVRADQLDAEASAAEFVEVLSVHPGKDATTLVVYRLPDGNIDTEMLYNGTHPLRLATEAELEQARQNNHRARIAADLHALGTLIEQHQLPVGRSINIMLRAADMGDLASIAERLGGKVEQAYQQRHEVAWPVGVENYEPGLHVEWYADAPKADPEPEPELVGPREVDNGDEPAPIPAGVAGQPVGQKAGRRFRAHP